MIKQYRHGSKKITLEIPGGLVDDEHPEKAALRELLEETGYQGNGVTYLGATNPNPAIFNNLCPPHFLSKSLITVDCTSAELYTDRIGIKAVEINLFFKYVFLFGRFDLCFTKNPTHK